MLKKVNTKKLKIDQYQSIIGPELIKIKKEAKKLKNKKILHLNSASRGGGVAEILQSLVPLQRDLGMKVDWKTFEAPVKFFEITKKIHNSLQGGSEEFTPEEFDFYLKINNDLSRELDLEIKKNEYDLIIFHDPQPMASASALTNSVKKISRIHIDLSKPNYKTLNFFKPFFQNFDGLIFSLNKFVPKEINNKKVFLIPPAIDPLNPKNVQIHKANAKKILETLNIDTSRPFISQVSRFDYWKNPAGVLEIYLKLKKEYPDLQLVLLGIAFAKDDPEAIQIYEQIKKAAGNDSDIHLLFDPKDLLRFENEEVVNAIQLESLVILQNSIKEGFGLTATEAMWKGNVVLAGNVGGLKIQIKNKKNGYLINNSDEAVEIIKKIIKKPKLKEKIGKSAKKSVKKRFLITRLLKNHIKTYNRIIETG